MKEKNTLSDKVDLLLAQYKQSTDAKEKKRLKDVIVSTCAPLVKNIAYSISTKCSEPFEDIAQIGAIGLIKAIELYEQKPDKHFNAYAKSFIIGEIKHYLRDNTNLMKTSRGLKELAFKIKKTSEELTEKLGRVPTNKDIAEALKVTEEKIEECLNLEKLSYVVSFDQVDNTNDSDDNAVSIADKIEDERAKALINSFENRIVLDEIIEKLDTLEHDLVISYYYDDLSQTELAVRFNISQAQVALKLKHALKVISANLSRKG